MPDDVLEKVDDPIAAYKAMETWWNPVDHLLGGTPALRAARERYLPRFKGEDLEVYEFRLNNSFLQEMFSDTVRKLSAKPFSRPVTFRGPDLPKNVGKIIGDADLAGRPLIDFMQDDFESCVSYGMSHVLVDLPSGLTGKESLGELDRLGTRPYFVQISARDLIGWRSERLANGKRVLKQIRFRESAESDKGMFGTKKMKRVRVFNAPTFDPDDPGKKVEEGSWLLYEQGENGKWIVISSGTYSADVIPLVTWYTRRTGFMQSRPPLEALAFKNIEHWASSSDQRNILHFARTGTMYATGLTDDEYEEFDNEVAIGMNQILRSKNEVAKFGVVEHAGKAVEAGERDLKRIEDQGEKLGDQPMVEAARDTTATATRERSSERLTLMQSWIYRQERAYEKALRLAGVMIGEDVHEDFGVDIFSDFASLLGGSSDLDILDKARARGDITNKTFLSEFKRRAVLAENVDVEEEAAAAEQESMSTMERFVPPPRDDAGGGPGRTTDPEEGAGANPES